MKTRDLHVESIRPLLPPAILLEELPLSEKGSLVVGRTREEVTRILRGEDGRLLVIVGPCSIHDPVAGLDYARRLKKLADELGHDLRLVLDLVELGLPSGCEFLDPITPQFTSDLVTWGAIGARTTESQVHRELASGLSMPVGFKNGTDGGVQIAIDAVRAAVHPHRFLGVTEQGLCAIVATRGNPDCHVILRGGASGSNYDAVSVQKTTAALVDAGLPPRLMIDTSHGNSDKDYRRQPVAGRDIAEQVAHGEAAIFGVMMESFLVDGRQELADPAALRYGQSITDACMGWEMTTPVLAELARAVRSRRSTS